MLSILFNKISSLLLKHSLMEFSGFCVNDYSTSPSNLARGWKCDLSQAWFSNSTHLGFSSPTSTPSKGTPSLSSDPLKAPSGLSWSGVFGASAIGNPTETKNYYQSLKWGQASGTNNKWIAGGTDSEKGYRYEGDYQFSFVIDRILAQL